MTSVLVTGATGFVGSRLAQRLRQRGDDVLALVRTPSDALRSIGVRQHPGGLDALDQGDIGSVDAVVHGATSFDPDLDAARLVNRLGTRRVLAHASRFGAGHAVHVSTTAVYDVTAAGDAVLDESAPLVEPGAAPTPTSSSGSAYAVSKAEGEAEVARAAAAGLSTTVLRPPAVLGIGPTSMWGTRVPARFQAGTWVPPHLATTFAWIHVEDLVEAILTALDRRTTGTLNVVGGHSTFGAYVDALRGFVSDPTATVPAAEARRWQGGYATTRAAEALGFRSTWTFDGAMTEIAASWKDRDPTSGADALARPSDGTTGAAVGPAST